MGETDLAAGSRARLERMQGYLQADPDNARLIADCAAAALEAGAVGEARGLAERLEPASPARRNLDGLIAMADRRFEDAVAAFEALAASGEGAPAVAYNLAWARAMTGDYAGALAALDDRVVEAVPQAGALKVRVLHHLGRLDEALSLGQALSARSPSDGALTGALSVVALDAGDIGLAETYARAAGDNADALATLGMLDLNEERIGEASALFDRALTAAPGNARAQLGKGLELLVAGRPAAAAAHIDRAAVLFDRHLGSWVAAGWAHFSAGDAVRARADFERALALDDTFAEAHGGLAVLDILEGRNAAGKRRAAVATRLDRNCLSAALAKVLLLSRDGKTAAADKIRQTALNRPLGVGGKTIAQAMVRLGFSAGTGSDGP